MFLILSSVFFTSHLAYGVPSYGPRLLLTGFRVFIRDLEFSHSLDCFKKGSGSGSTSRQFFTLRILSGSQAERIERQWKPTSCDNEPQTDLICLES